MTTKAILKNTYFDTCIGTRNKSKDTRKISEGPLFIDAKTTHIKSHISHKLGKNIDNQYKESRLKSSELNSRESQTESETCSDNFGDSGQSKDDPEALTNEYNYKFGIENSDSFTNSEDEFAKTELTMDTEQDVREIDRINNQRNLLNRNALKKPKLRPSPIDPKDITTMWEKFEDAQSGESLAYENIFYYQNGQKVYLKDLSPSEVVEILHEASGSDTEKKKKISGLKEQFISLIQNDHGKLKNLKREKEKFESETFNLLKPYDFEPVQKIVIQTAILAEAVAVLLRDTFTDFAKLSDDDIADAIIAAFLYKSKSDWLDGANLCFNSENYVKKILASVFPNLDEQRCMRIANAIDHKKDPLFDSDGSMKKDLLAIILQITDHLDHQDDIKFFDFTNKNYKIDAPSFNFSSILSSEEVHARVITFLERARQFININIDDPIKEVLSDLKTHPSYSCHLGRSFYEIYRNGPANDTHLFKVDRPYFKYSSQPCDDVSYGIKMENVTPEQISKFLSLGGKDEFKAKVQSSKRMFMLLRKKDRKPEEGKELGDINKNLPKFVGKKFSELFRYENVFEIAENFLKLPKITISAFLTRRGFSSIDIDHTLSIAASCLELKKNGWSEKFAQRVTFYRICLLEDKVLIKGHRGKRGAYDYRPSLSLKKTIEKSLLQYSTVEMSNQVTISHTRNCMHKFAKFVYLHGGIYPLIELLMWFQNTSSWCTIPVIIKAWLLHQREDPNASWGVYLNEKPATVDPNSAFFHFTDGTLLEDKEGVERYLKIISNQEESFYDKLFTQTLAFNRCGDFLYYEQDVIHQADDSIKKVLNSGSTEDCLAQLKSIRDNLGKVMSNIEKQIERQNNSSTSLFAHESFSDLETEIKPALTGIISDLERAVEPLQGKLENELPKISQKLSDIRKLFDNVITIMFAEVAVDRHGDIKLTDMLKTEADKSNTLNEGNVRMFNETLYMFYAFVQNMLYLTPDFPEEFYRSFDNKALENYFGCTKSEENAKSITKKLKNTAMYDPYSVTEFSQYGINTVKISPDPWRIFIPYPLLCSLIPSWQVDYNEFDIMAGDCDATILEDDPNEDSDKGFCMHSFPRSHSDKFHGGYSDCGNRSTYSEGSDTEV